MSLPLFYQYPLDLKFEPALEAEDYFVNKSNQHIIETLKNWQTWKENSLIITAPPGGGKTHLLKVWQRISQSKILEATALKDEELLGLLSSTPAIAIDDIESIKEPRLLLHVFNLAKDLSLPFIMTTSLLPHKWQFFLPDLESRLKSIPLLALPALDDQLLAALIIKQLDDHKLSAPLEVIKFIVTNCERSFTAVRSLVGAISQLSLSKHKKVSLPLVREALKIFPLPQEEDLAT